MEIQVVIGRSNFGDTVNPFARIVPALGRAVDHDPVEQLASRCPSLLGYSWHSSLLAVAFCPWISSRIHRTRRLSVEQVIDVEALD
jgi:hypothetical protein